MGVYNEKGIPMPKSNRPPKYSKNGKYAIVYVNGKKIYLGLYGSTESRQEYARVVAEWQFQPIPQLANCESNVSVSELVAGFLDYSKSRQDKIQYRHNKYAIGYLVKFYGSLDANEFSPKKLKLCRSQMVKTGSMCRNHINDYTRRIIRVFSWGVQEELVKPDIVAALREVKSLRKGEEGAFDNPPRKPVSVDAVRKTLSGASPTVSAMIQVQGMMGERPSAVFLMRVREIDRNQRSNGLWYYTPNSHKTEQYIGDKIIPLGKPEQELIAPYLEGKNPEDAVFSPRTSMKEHATERRLERKYPMTPSQAERNQERARNPKRTLNEFYDQSSYRNAVEHAIKKVNKGLPDEEKVPHWTPYQLRHFQATALKKNKDAGRILAQAALAHTSPETTDIYIDDNDEQLIIREILAMERKNPFESEE